jgi:DNA gyrase/topoisomerase IV subunit B
MLGGALSGVTESGSRFLKQHARLTVLRGTTISFCPDRTVLGETQFDETEIQSTVARARLRK